VTEPRRERETNYRDETFVPDRETVVCCARTATGALRVNPVQIRSGNARAETDAKR
jgi:hypothetical protein